MPLGLRNSAQTFQRAMNHLLRRPTIHPMLPGRHPGAVNGTRGARATLAAAAAHGTAHRAAQRPRQEERKLTWTPEAEAAFERTKKAMTEAVRSSFLSPSQPLALYTDASDTGHRCRAEPAA
ncbi:unnamed protein product [Trichogramma brassicae]|uniref:Uncharacterized protein n=1 Tax=Trichogramma brassicae TaxID=86971 RepID=A0A6H5IVG8_9HYME|nr:unnamed protein product [Trichogramma brassicae]